VQTSVSDPHSFYADPDPDPNPGLNLASSFHSEIQFNFFVKKDTLEQFIQTPFSKICIHPLDQILMMNFLSFGSVFSLNFG
jgi:hypothetical protein